MASQADAVRQFMTRRPRAPRDSAGGVIVVAAGKGGVGTSTISLLLGIAAAGRGIETLVVDAAAGTGTLNVIVDQPNLDGRNAELLSIADHLTLAVPGTPVDESEMERRIRYRRLASSYGDYGCVIVDAGSRSASIAAALTDARQLLLVATPDRVCVTATYALYKQARGLSGVPASTILNRCTPDQAARAMDALRAGAERFLGGTLENAATVPDDARLADCMNDGTLLANAPHTHAFAALQPVALLGASRAAPLLFAI